MVYSLRDSGYLYFRYSRLLSSLVACFKWAGGGRGKTWVYLEKGDADAEWEIEELHTGGEDDPEIYWQVKEEYKRLD